MGVKDLAHKKTNVLGEDKPLGSVSGFEIGVFFGVCFFLFVYLSILFVWLAGSCRLLCPRLLPLVFYEHLLRLMKHQDDVAVRSASTFSATDTRNKLSKVFFVLLSEESKDVPVQT